MRLQRADIVILLEAMEASFDPFSLQKLLQTRAGLKYHNITAVMKNFEQQVVDVHDWFDMRNETERLVAALRDARPAVAELSWLSDRLGFATIPPPGALEILARKSGQAYQDPSTFRSCLARREAAVCRVDTAEGSGTGFLVGRGMVLTNHHVIAAAMDAAGQITGASCLFDFRRNAEGYATPGLQVKVTAVLASSPPARADMVAEGVNTDPRLLDYALLKLERDVDAEPIVSGGDQRGSIPITAEPKIPAISAGLLVLQHPRARPMKMDIGAVSWTGATRIRHSVNTEPGSSGSPVFDGGLNLVALHHAGHDWPHAAFPYNQAIPLALIAADMRRHGVAL